MSAIIHNKLVRDKILEIITSDGKVHVSRILSDKEYKTELRAKLVEEAGEVRDSGGDIDEYADVLEVFLSAIEADGYTIESVEKARVAKSLNRGGFKDKIFLEKVIDADSV